MLCHQNDPKFYIRIGLGGGGHAIKELSQKLMCPTKMAIVNIFWQPVHKVTTYISNNEHPTAPCSCSPSHFALQNTHVKGCRDSTAVGAWGCLCEYSVSKKIRHKMQRWLEKRSTSLFCREVPVAQHENGPLNAEVLQNLGLIRPPSSSPSSCFLCGFRFTSLGLFVVVCYYLINYCGSCSCQKAERMPCFINIHGHVTIFLLWGSKYICDYFFQIN